MAFDMGNIFNQQSANNMGALQGAQSAQESNSTQQQIATIQTQMQAENMKATEQRHQIMMETMNKIRDMRNETHMNRLKSSDKHHKSMTDTIKG